MKVAFLSESSADESALHILVEALLGRPIEPVVPHDFQVRQGWTHVKSVIRPLIIKLHFSTDAEALVIVVDSDGFPVHIAAHELPNAADEGCRVCQLLRIVEETQRTLERRPRFAPNLIPMKIAVGLAVPAIEAWYLCGCDPEATEAGLTQRQDAKSPDLRKELKRRVYGTDRASLSEMEKCAIREAQRLAQDIVHLEQCFQNGFGKLARDIRGW